MSQSSNLTTRLKQALHLDSKSGGTPQAADVAAGTADRGTTADSGRTTTGAGNGGMRNTGTTSNTIGGTGIPAGSSSTTMDLPNRSGLASSSDHWAKAEAATQEARRQAALVEQGARSHREASEEYFRAEREVTTARHTVEEIETKLRNLGLEAKQARATEARSTYEAEQRRLAGLRSGVQSAQADADAAQKDVNAKGHELEARVAESKLASDRLAALEAELAEARAAEAEAANRHKLHLADLTPLRNKHQHHRAERERLAGRLAKLQTELDGVRAAESAAGRRLDQGDEGLASQIADLEAAARRKEQEAASHKAERDNLATERERLMGLLGQHRDQVSSLTKDTQATMARAQAQSDAADAKAADLQQTREALATSDREVRDDREALAAAVAKSRELQSAARSTAGAVEDHAQQASALEAELRAAKERVDLAQARKEELWEKAKAAGSAGDNAADTHYTKHVAEPAGEDPSDMVHKSDKTESLAGKIKYGVESVLHANKSATSA